MMTSWKRLAWTGRVDLGADLVLEPFDDDEALDALAAFLFAHRRD
jgi:hypothetical protein